MPPIPKIPAALKNGPFTTAYALSLGVTERMLRGASWRRLFPRVWVWVGHVMTRLDWIVAAGLSLPPRAKVSHLSRIQTLGLDFGPLRPFQFTIAGDHHIDIADIFLHRTVVLPPLDDGGVTPAAAFVQYCADARFIDAIKVGDWLLSAGHMTVAGVLEVARRQHWRPGAAQAVRVLPELDAASRSLKESETRAIFAFAGLPRPEVNKNLYDARGEFLGCGDLVYVEWKLLAEYEGRHHEGDLNQWNRDIDRYRGFRDDDWRYVQITNEKLGNPRRLIAEVHAQLVRCGYSGPAPAFGRRWRSLFEPVRIAGLRQVS